MTDTKQDQDLAGWLRSERAELVRLVNEAKAYPDRIATIDAILAKMEALAGEQREVATSPAEEADAD